MEKKKKLSLLPFSPFLHFLLILAAHHSLIDASTNPDAESLLAFKAGSDASNKLSSWNGTADPCVSWYGVSCYQNRVSRLVLEGLDLNGTVQPLTALSGLRVLSLKKNQFSGPIPDLSNLTALKLLFLSYNDFSGDFPMSVLSLVRLYRLDLSHNNLSGQIPANINLLSHILTLRLEENRFTGSISGLNLPNLQDFNVSGNRLTGSIPKSLSGFPETVFGRNSVLCGPPLPPCRTVVSDPSRPDNGVKTPPSPLYGASPTVVSSTPSSKPEVTTAAPGTHRVGGGKMSRLALIAIVVGDLFVLVLVSGLLFCCFWKGFRKPRSGGKGSSRILEGEKIVYSSSPYPPSQGGFERGKMIFFDVSKRFELEDLLRASAEMLGKGGFGTAYKAILEDGNVVAVKRLKEVALCGKREFEQQMELLGRLKHPNIVGLKAFYYARDEKLLVYEYMPNGSLFSLLHGNRGPGRTPLDWTTRMKIAAGAARGVAFIHNACRAPKLSHGNIKSTNVLLDKAGNARVSDFGLSAFSAMVPKSNGYRAPEISDGRKFSQKADVYAFGVLLLELLTGKCPSSPDNTSGGTILDLPRWVQSVVREEWTAEVFDLELMRYKDIEEEMVGMLQIGMACTSLAPDQRPRMGQVVKMIEEIRGGGGDLSPSHDSFDSVSDSPSVSEDAGGVSQ
ncbi:probable leucine-rich repeat receptor-like protein kinase At1g68400 [Magnolia sinica]|uniref:probable leucine-rich repeat receptor-like protein kinase At1g68400 n=1 Tax=Magnolia sinica TaxID=86752 RepID=UPI002658365E|nr:probable leucine-rich repeat receptor-like protein kinase At1g68400 [Magnolia sinica]